MDTLAYLHLVAAYEDPTDYQQRFARQLSRYLDGLHGRIFPIWAFARLLSVGIVLAAMTATGDAMAVLLERGSSGEAVTRLQQTLTDIGVYDGPITGFYGEQTETAVIRFQQQNNLSPDGIFGANTEAALYNRDRPSASVQSYNAPFEPSNRTWQRGNEDPEIKAIQTTLKNAGYYRGPITGFFGRLTENALKDYQNNKGLEVTGTFNASTRAALFGQSSAAVAAKANAKPQNRPTAAVTQQSPQPLQRGDSGNRVVVLQRRLQDLGYYDGGINGRFNNLTEAAVLRFQQDKGLAVTGVVNAQTVEQINNSRAEPVEPQDFNNPIQLGLQRGSSGSAVRELQQRLQAFNTFDGEIDGAFGPRTEAALVRFQQANGLAPTGGVDEQTRDLLGGTLPNATASSPSYSPSYSNRPLQISRNLDIGDTGEDVRRLQEYLRDLGYFDPNVTATGYYGEITKEAVRDFQRDRGLSPDGEVGSNTRAELAGTVGTTSFVADPIPEPEPAPISRTLREGSFGSDVEILQQRLRSRGFYQGSIDGDFGPQTEAAVRRFQQARGLSVDGIAGTNTLDALFDGRTERYVVVVPERNNYTLEAVRQAVSQATLANDQQRGPYVNAGEFNSRDRAERVSQALRSRGLDARVAYF